MGTACQAERIASGNAGIPKVMAAISRVATDCLAKLASQRYVIPCSLYGLSVEARQGGEPGSLHLCASSEADINRSADERRAQAAHAHPLVHESGPGDLILQTENRAISTSPVVVGLPKRASKKEAAGVFPL